MSKSKNMTGYSLAVFLTLVLVAAVASAQETIVTLNFTGHVRFVNGTPLGLTASIGDPVQGSITYDPNLSPYSNDGTMAWYYDGIGSPPPPPKSSMTLVIGGATVKSTGYAAILVANDLGGYTDGISMFFHQATVVGGSSTYGELTFTLWDTTATAFSSTALPLTLNLADFGPNPDNRYGAVHEGSIQIIFNLDRLAPDADGDGVLDDVDQCPNSDLSATVVIDECNSGVTNTLFLTGCTISDLIAECAEGASIHGQFVSCVTNLTIDLKQAGIVTGLQQGAIVSCAALAAIP